MKVSVERIYYPVKVLGPGNRVGIWLRGCNKNCDGCISPEMQTYDKAKEVEINDIVQMISSIPNKIDGVTISGGEPFYNPKALCELVNKIKEITDDILIFTGFTYEELQSRNDENIGCVLNTISAIVDGPFQRELHSDTGLKGSSNQKLTVFKYFEKYKYAELEKRELQIVVSNGRLITIGIP